MSSKSNRTRKYNQPAWRIFNQIMVTYFERNISQFTYIFWFSVIAIFTGFAFIIWGLYQSVQNGQGILPAGMAVVSGLISEFIGATFLFIYRSSVKQASQNLQTLERIMSKFGMAEYFLSLVPKEYKKNEEFIKVITSIAKKALGDERISEAD